MFEKYKAKNGTTFKFNQEMDSITIRSRKKEISFNAKDMLEFIKWIVVQIIMRSSAKEFNLPFS